MRGILLIVTSAAVLLQAAISHAATNAEEHVAVNLIGEHSAVVAGTTTWLGIQIKHEPHWHTYWLNPGDSGLPTKLAWSVPYGFVPGEIAWPAPKRFDVGGLFNFGYDADVVLPVPMRVSIDAVPGSTAHISVIAKWLVCHEECVPGKATLTLDLPVATTAVPDPRWKTQFAAAHAAQPQPGTWSGEARLVGDHIEAALRGTDLPPAAALQVFPLQTHIVAYAPPHAELRNGALMLTFAKSDYYTSAPATFDLVLENAAVPQAHAWSVTLPFSAASSAASTQP
jgi:DsbC/DsbD-like thiol-disulfide interchange protein